ncbi:MAG: hypothetical protein IT534_07170 [Bauldia sp.]|nr:hypothetical protein [Bauldia sp.]
MPSSGLTRLASAAFLTALAGAAIAQELPRSGEFTSFFTHVNPNPFGAVPVGDGNVAFALTFISASVNAAGEGFMHDLRGRCIALQTINSAAGTFEVEGYCDWQDQAGDHIFESFWSDGPTPLVEGPLGGKETFGRFVGGTGRYEGITGDVTITVFGASTTHDGYEQVIGGKVGTYTLP